MTTLERITEGARAYLRDWPRFFSATVAKEGLSRIFDLPHSNILDSDLLAVLTDGTASYVGSVERSGGAAATDTTFLYALDAREGLLRITQPPLNAVLSPATSLYIEGYYTEWISSEDMKYFANNMITEHATGQLNYSLDKLSDAEEDALALGSAVESIWSLLIEYSRDIDINTPESISLPVSMRFRQAQQLLTMLSGKYAEKANFLGIGLARIQSFNALRVSRTTNRLVPRYREREFDDASIRHRIFHEVDSGGGTSNPPDDFTPAALGTSVIVEQEFY